MNSADHEELVFDMELDSDNINWRCAPLSTVSGAGRANCCCAWAKRGERPSPARRSGLAGSGAVYLPHAGSFLPPGLPPASTPWLGRHHNAWREGRRRPISRPARELRPVGSAGGEAAVQ